MVIGIWKAIEDGSRGSTLSKSEVINQESEGLVALEEDNKAFL
jgi:hypothetical protein